MSPSPLVGEGADGGDWRETSPSMPPVGKGRMGKGVATDDGLCTVR
jgi:hypothetical protein